MPINFLTTEVYYKKWYLKPFIKAIGSFPVVRQAWTLDQFLLSSIEKLKNGKTIMFFPEGKIVDKYDLNNIRPGIGYLSDKSERVLIPMHINWAKGSMLKQLTISFGKPIIFQEETSSLDAYQEYARNVMDTIYSL